MNRSSRFLQIHDSSALTAIFRHDDRTALDEFISDFSTANFPSSSSSFNGAINNDDIMNNIIIEDKRLPKCLQSSPFLLDFAAYYAAVECLRFVLVRLPDKMSKVNHVDLRGKTVVHFAAYSGNVNVLKLLAEFGFDVLQRDSKGRTPLYQAVKYDHIQVVKFLCVNTTVLTEDKEVVQELLQLAASSNCSFKIFTFLMQLSNCFDLCKADSKGATFYSKAIENENQELLNFLLNEFVPQNSDGQGLFPIHYAAMFNNPEFITSLLEYGAEIDSRDHKNATPLMLACQRGSYDAAIALLDLGASVNEVDANGRTAMHFAAKYGHDDIVEILYDFNADPEVFDNEMMTPMNLAFLSRRGDECVRFFKEIGLECDNEELLISRHQQQQAYKRKKSQKNSGKKQQQQQQQQQQQKNIIDDIEIPVMA